MSKILAIIPARGGSKGIVDKNIMEINGNPLIYYTLKPAVQALESKTITKLIVSTDSEKIATIARSCNAEVPFLRPAELSSDKSKSSGYIKHALDFFNNRNETFDFVLILQPTSPFRDALDIKNCIELFSNRKISRTLISAYKEDYIDDLVCYRLENSVGIPLNKEHNKGTRRQDRPSLYVRNGAFYLFETSYFLETEQIIDDYPMIYEMPKSKSVNIDTAHDAELTRLLFTFNQNQNF